MTRRRTRDLFGVAASAALVTLLAACSGSPGGGSAGEPTSSAEQEDDFPTSIEHVHGTTTIDAEPERVVAVGIGDTDVLLALGIQPVMVPVWNGAFDDGIGTWAEDLLSGPRPEPLQSATTEFSIEAVAAAEPDLIVAVNNAIDAARYEQLSGVAPTVLHSAEHDDWVLPWQDVTTRIGQAVGRADEARDLVAETEAYIEGASAENEHFRGRTGALVRILDGNTFRVYSTEAARGQLLAALGFVIPSEIENQFSGALFLDVPLENLSLLDLDVLVVDNYAAHEDLLSSQALFTGLDVVSSGGLVALDAVTSDAVSMPNPLTIPFVLDAFAELLNETPVGEGA
jgi:iron complex transport system substrate-binding protein